MALYNLKIFALADSTTTPQSGILSMNVTGEQWSWGWSSPPTLTIDSGAVAQTVEIDDTDLNPLGFSDENSSSGPYDVTSQALTSDLTINGTTYQAGLLLQNEYEAQFTDSLGNSYTMVAVSVQVPRNGGTDYSGGYDPEFIGLTWEGAVPPLGEALTATTAYEDNATMMPICFVAGTLIKTPTGQVPVETLKAGDLVLTADNGAQPIRWIGSRHVSGTELAAAPKLRPIKVASNALASGLPESDLFVSPQHRLLVRSRIAQRRFGANEILTAAKHLTQIDGIEIAGDLEDVAYFHILFDQHEIIYANGAEAESLYAGPEALKSVSEAARTEILTLFPELRKPDPAFELCRTAINGRAARNLAARHKNHDRALVS